MSPYLIQEQSSMVRGEILFSSLQEEIFLCIVSMVGEEGALLLLEWGTWTQVSHSNQSLLQKIGF